MKSRINAMYHIFLSNFVYWWSMRLVSVLLCLLCVALVRFKIFWISFNYPVNDSAQICQLQLPLGLLLISLKHSTVDFDIFNFQN